MVPGEEDQHSGLVPSCVLVNSYMRMFVTTKTIQAWHGWEYQLP